MDEFEIDVSHSQVAVFNADLENPFNDWSERNFSQGFAWRDVSVSFRTPFDGGRCKVSFYMNDPPSLSKDAIRAFRVPFLVTNGVIEVASIPTSVQVDVPVGQYSLQAEFLAFSGREAQEVIIRLNSGTSGFSILVADDEIDCSGEFDLGGHAAI